MFVTKLIQFILQVFGFYVSSHLRGYLRCQILVNMFLKNKQTNSLDRYKKL